MIAACTSLLGQACSTAPGEPGDRPRAAWTVADLAASTGTGLPGKIAGVSPEAHGNYGPFRDGNGNLYTIAETEPTSETWGDMKAMKSSDGGRTWTEVDAGNKPEADDFEAGWAVQRGTVLHVVHQDSTRVTYHTFNTSDASRRPDRWVIRDERVARLEKRPTDQWASLALLRNGDAWAFYGLSVDGTDRIGYRKRTDGSWGPESMLDAGRTTTQAVPVLGRADVVHVFYKDQTDHRVLHRSLRPGGGLSARTRVDDTGSHVVSAPITNAVRYSDHGVETVVVAWADRSSVLRSARLRDGVPTAETAISSSPVLVDPSKTTNRTAVAHLARDGKTVHAVWADRRTADVFHDTNTDGRGWRRDTEIRDGVTAQWVYAGVFTHAPRNGGAKVLGYIYDNNTDGDPETYDLEYHQRRLPRT